MLRREKSSSLAKMAFDNKTKLRISLRSQASLKIEAEIRPDIAEFEKEKVSTQEDAIQELELESKKELTTKLKSIKDRKQSEEFEVKDYNASPKLAVKSTNPIAKSVEKEKKKQTKEKPKSPIKLKPVMQGDTESGNHDEEKEAPAKEEEKKVQPPTISVPMGNMDGDLDSLNLIKVNKLERATSKKSPNRKDQKKSGTVKRVLS